MEKAHPSGSKFVAWIKARFSRSRRPRTSSILPESHSHRDPSEALGRTDRQDEPEASRVVDRDATRRLPLAQSNLEHDRMLINQASHESTRLSIHTNRSHHDRPPSNRTHRPAVRLLSQEQAIGSSGLTRLKMSQVLCTLVISYNNQHVVKVPDLVVDYWEESAFDEIALIAMKELTKHNGKSPETFYLKVGRFRLVRQEPAHVLSRGILENKREWDESLPYRIAEFRGQYRSVPLSLEIEWDYSSLVIEQVRDQPYALTISNVIESKIRKNWEGRKYVPQKDLKKIFTEDTIRKLVKEDETLRDAEFLTLNGGNILNTDEFTNKIYLWRSRLLAWCVYNDLPLIYLFRLERQGLQDKNLPLHEDNCPDPAYRRRFDQALTNIGGFAAHTFLLNADEETKHTVLPPGSLVPILFDKSDKECWLGQGSFGQVFKVRIDPDHHSFSTVKDEEFAFKIFYDYAHTQNNVANESGTLARLAKVPHPNVTTHLASWNQKGTCYMLFRCADCNLRTFMATTPSPEWTKLNLLALVSQMKALADGLRLIHNLGPSELEPDHIGQKAKAREPRPSESCFHHDLKPSNILVFINQDTGEILFSISDFGSARIGKILSGSLQPSPFTQNLSPGDAAYGAPDAILVGKTSRPYDMWSMGCIFLELLTWIVGLKERNVQAFADMRMQEVSSPEGNQDQAFWYKDRAGEVRLKGCVVRQLETLKEKCDGRGVFPQLVRLIGKLLNIWPRDRPEASKLHNDLDAILIQLNEDLKDEDFYLEEKPTEVRIAAPPSSVAGSDDLPRRPSIDTRSFPPRFGDTLPVNHGTTRRSSVSAAYPANGRVDRSAHARHYSTPEASADRRHLSIDTRVESASSTSVEDNPNTPRISFSDFDVGVARTEAWLNTNSVTNHVSADEEHDVVPDEGALE